LKSWLNKGKVSKKWLKKNKKIIAILVNQEILLIIRIHNQGMITDFFKNQEIKIFHKIHTSHHKANFQELLVIRWTH
jgi:hypothetical protein